MRIMHIVDTLGKGGLENGLVNVIERLEPQRFEHVVCAIRALGPNAERLSLPRVQVTCLADESRPGRFQIGPLARVIRKFEPDIVHTRNWGAIEGAIAARWVRSCKVVHSEHGLELDTNATEPWRRVWLRRIGFEAAHRVFTVSRQLREVHAARTGFATRKITVIHNGVDSSCFRPDAGIRGRMRAELGLAPGEICIGCVGNLSPAKDHITVLRGIAGFAETWANWRLLMVGAGPELPKLNAFLQDRPELRRRVVLVGASHRVPELLQAMDMYVLSSVIEGISNATLEAMATGLPVVVTNTGGNPEIVVDGKSGLLFPVGDFERLKQHLILLKRDAGLRYELGQAAMRRVREEFSIESMVKKYDELYTSLRPAMNASPEAALGV